jgi:hypothetical protein
VPILVPATFYYKQIDGSGAVEALGSFRLASAMDLQQVFLTVLKRGPWVGAERFRLKVFPTADSTVALYTSDWRDLDELEEVEPAHWLGVLRFDFAGVPINPTLTYHLKIEGDGYTPTASFWVGVLADWPVAVHSSASSARRAMQANFVGLQPFYPDPDREDLMGQFRRGQIAEGVTITAPTDLQVGVNIDVVYDGTTAVKAVDVSAYVSDARKATWTLRKPSGSNFEQVIGVVITSTSATNVTLTTDSDFPLPSGTYRLVGVY